MQTGLNGWFGRFLKRAIVKVASLVDSSLNTSTFGASSEIGSFSEWANEIGSGGSDFWNRYSNNTSNSDDLYTLENDPRGNYEPTQLEAIELEKFSNVLAKIITDVSKQQMNVISVYNSTGASNIYRYSVINNLLERITVIREYYKYNETNYLSKQAIELRNLMVEVLFLKIINEIEDLGWNNTTYALTSNSILIPVRSVVKELTPYSKTTSFDLVVNYYLFKEAKVNNLDLVDVIYPIDNTDTTTDSGTDSGTTTTTTTTETPKPKKSGFGGLLAGLLFGAAVLIVANSDDDDKKKKQKQK